MRPFSFYVAGHRSHRRPRLVPSYSLALDRPALAHPVSGMGGLGGRVGRDSDRLEAHDRLLSSTVAPHILKVFWRKSAGAALVAFGVRQGPR